MTTFDSLIAYYVMFTSLKQPLSFASLRRDPLLRWSHIESSWQNADLQMLSYLDESSPTRAPTQISVSLLASHFAPFLSGSLSNALMAVAKIIFFSGIRELTTCSSPSIANFTTPSLEDFAS